MKKAISSVNSRLGFDLDGVIVNKPPFIPKSVIEFLFKGGCSGLDYRFPRSKLEQQIRRWSHFYLFRPPLKKNLELIRKISRLPSKKLYLISSRYSFLKPETNLWLAKRGLGNLFSTTYLNEKNEPPPLFKEKLLRRLKLDYYFEDDPQIADYLRKKIQPTKILLVSKDNDQSLKDQLTE